MAIKTRAASKAQQYMINLLDILRNLKMLPGAWSAYPVSVTTML